MLPRSREDIHVGLHKVAHREWLALALDIVLCRHWIKDLDSQDSTRVFLDSWAGQGERRFFLFKRKDDDVFCNDQTNPTPLGTL